MFPRLEEYRFARWAKGLNRAAQIVLSLSLVAGLNLAASRHFDRFDLTPNHVYSLSAETRAYLSKIPNKPADPPVEIALIIPLQQNNAANQEAVDVLFTEMRNLIREYTYAAKLNPGGPVPLIAKEVDLYRQSREADRLGKLGLKIDASNPVMFISRGNETGLALSLADLYEMDHSTPTAFKGENAITSAILNVIQEKSAKIYFTRGHGEMNIDGVSNVGLSKLSDALRLRNYALDSIDLSAAGEIPDDAKTIVIASPSKTAFQPYEVEKLRRYLSQRNGRLVILLKPGQNSGLEDLMHEWGLRSDDALAVEFDTNRLSGYNNTLIKSFADNPITHVLPSYQLDAVLGPPRPVRPDMTASTDERLKITPLMQTSGQSFSTPNYDKTKLVPGHGFNPITDFPPGAVPVAALSEKLSSDALGLPGGKLIVFGDADFIANSGFDVGGNSFLSLNTFNYMTSRENLLNLPPKIPLHFKLNLSVAQLKGLAWRLAILPVILALLGAFVFVNRRRA